jgi:hypothetical protein
MAASFLSRCRLPLAPRILSSGQPSHCCRQLKTPLSSGLFINCYPAQVRSSSFHTSSIAMGIHGLSKVIGDNAKDAIKEDDIKNYFGRKVAIDASMSIYQFMIAVRQQDGQLLQNEYGETTR